MGGRDLKPENFIYSDPSSTARLKLVDFGFACLCSDPTSASGVCGSPGASPPSLLPCADPGSTRRRRGAWDERWRVAGVLGDGLLPPRGSLRLAQRCFTGSQVNLLAQV